MTDSQLTFTRDRRAGGIAATMALHLALVLAWQWANAPQPAGPQRPSRVMQWVDVIPLSEPPPTPRSEPPAHAPAPALRKARKEKPDSPPVASMALVPPVAEAPVASLPESDPTAAPAQSRSADDIMQQAKRHVGVISKDLKKEFPGPKIRAPLDTPQSRLVKGIELAHEMAPPKLWEAPKVQELTTGFAGTRRYRVITGNGTYCITVGPTHTATGLTMGGNANAQRLTTCPKDELPKTTQNYDERP